MKILIITKTCISETIYETFTQNDNVDMIKTVPEITCYYYAINLRHDHKRSRMNKIPMGLLAYTALSIQTSPLK